MGVVDSHHTFQVTTASARLTLTFSRDGRVVTTHEYGGALIKRVSVVASRKEAAELVDWLQDNLKVAPWPPPNKTP